MHHHETYMYINFQQNRVCRSVITFTQIYSRTVVKRVFFLEGQKDGRTDERKETNGQTDGRTDRHRD